MALEQPFTHWPFSKANSSRPGHQQSSQRTNERFKRYDTNDSPFKDISPIPGGRDFGTYPVHDRQPRTVAREEITQNLNIRASRGFIAPEELIENQFLPIPENEGITRDNPIHHQEPPFHQDPHSHQHHHSHKVQPDPAPVQEPWSGLSLMERYRDLNQEPRPVRRTNSLLEFAAFIGQVGEEPINKLQQNPPHPVPSSQQRQRKQPVITEQQSLKRMGVQQQQQQQRQQQQQAYPLQNGGSRRQPNGGLVGGQQYSSSRRQPNGGLNQRNGLTQLSDSQKPGVVPTMIPRYPTSQPISHQPLDDYPYVRRRPRRRREKKKDKNILCCGIGLVVTGFLVLSGFIAAFVSITLINDAWPSSGLLLAGVVFGLLLTIAGLIFACQKYFSMDYDGDYQPRNISAPVMEDNMAGMHPVWQASLQRSTLDRPANLEAMPMTDLHLVGGDDYTEQPPEPEINNGNIGETIPNMPNGSVPNGVPTPLAFATPFNTSPNDYHLY